MEVDLTGTEVSVDFSCEAEAVDNLMKVSVGIPVLKEGAENMTLNDAGDVVTVGNAAMKGVVRVPITLSWTDGDSDTEIGKTAATKTIPVTLTVQQHVSAN